MKKKLLKILEKDSFYLSLFACVCLVAIGGVWFTKNSVDELASNSKPIVDVNKNNDSELHLIKEDKNDAIPTATDSKENLKQAKENQEIQSKLSFLGTEVIREYSEKQPSYSKTLDVWEIHKGLDISSNKGQEVKSLLDGTVVDVYKDDQYGMSIKVKSEDNTTVVYSNLDSDIKVKKDQSVKQGECLGLVGNTTTVESEEVNHIHIQAYKDDKTIDPMTLIK